MIAADYVALAATYFLLLMICPIIVHVYHCWRRFVTTLREDVTLPDVCWDDFRCVVEVRVAYCREPWYPFGNRCYVEGGRLIVTDVEVLSAALLDWQSSTYHASELQCEAIRRTLMFEDVYKKSVQQRLEEAVRA